MIEENHKTIVSFELEFRTSNKSNEILRGFREFNRILLIIYREAQSKRM